MGVGKAVGCCGVRGVPLVSKVVQKANRQTWTPSQQQSLWRNVILGYAPLGFHLDLQEYPHCYHGFLKEYESIHPEINVHSSCQGVFTLNNSWKRPTRSRHISPWTCEQTLPRNAEGIAKATRDHIEAKHGIHWACFAGCPVEKTTALALK